MNTPAETPQIEKLKAPKSGVEVRMYRQGHGDCFLLSFKRRGRSRTPFHMLIDCGMKKRSNAVDKQGIPEILDVIHAQTDGKLDVVVITHEHEDHVSGFPKPDEDDHPFSKFQIEELWLAWTEDGSDEFANELREIYGDKLLALALTHHQLKTLNAATETDNALRETLEEFLELETGENDGLKVLKEVCEDEEVTPEKVAGPGFDEFRSAFAARRSRRVRGKRYKQRLQGLRRMAKTIRFLSPGDGPIEVEGVPVKFFPFGPPRDRKLLTSLDPRKKEEFHFGPFAMGDTGAGLFAAFEARSEGGTGSAPFAARHLLTTPGDESAEALTEKNYVQRVYHDGPEKRRIDSDWLSDAEGMALRLNTEVNNTSLVLGIELEKSKQVLLFTGDAQAGNWRSWQDVTWEDGDQTVTAKDLLGRCTFYKVGHHGSHNATLNGDIDSPHANLHWMAQGDYAEHFVAMIPTNRVWAYGKSRPWKHPMKAIEDALFQKAQSRVMMIRYMPDTGRGRRKKKVIVEEPDLRPETGVTAESDLWQDFIARTEYDQAFVKYWVEDRL